MCERILVPLDDSATARRGLQEAIRLAQMNRGASISFMCLTNCMSVRGTPLAT